MGETMAMAGDILTLKREDILRVARRHGVGRVRVFGSQARGSAGQASDVDLLIEVDGPTTPWFPGGLVADLEALLGCRVDVVEPDALHPEVRAHALAEALPL
jgi:predicted nucleotidyltransferase